MDLGEISMHRKKKESSGEEIINKKISGEKINTEQKAQGRE